MYSFGMGITQHTLPLGAESCWIDEQREKAEGCFEQRCTHDEWLVVETETVQIPEIHHS